MKEKPDCKPVTTTSWPKTRKAGEVLTDVMLKQSGLKCQNAYAATVLAGVMGDANIDLSIAVNGNINKIGSATYPLEELPNRPNVKTETFQPEVPSRQASQSEFPWYQTFQLELPSSIGRRTGEDIARDLCKRLQERKIGSTSAGRLLVFTLAVDGKNLKNMEALIEAQKERDSILKIFTK